MRNHRPRRRRFASSTCRRSAGHHNNIAEGLLRSEGFTDVEYVRPVSETGVSAVAGGRADMTIWDLPTAIPLLDQGKPTIVLAGIHSGCWDLYGNERVQKLRDLKGKRVSVYGVGG